MKKILIYYFFFLLSIFVFFSSGVVDSVDGFAYLAVSRNIYYKGEPVMQPYDYNEGKNIHMATYTGANGKPYSPTGLGYSLALLPSVAITDLFYKHYNITPPVYFPLESDWLILSLASLTNGFFASLLGVILVVYFIKLKIKLKQAFLMSFVTLFCTNLFVYGKHTVAHMMFITFLVLSFLLIKKYSDQKSKRLLFFAGIFYGILSITYNPTFILTLPPLIIYYCLLNNLKISKKNIAVYAKDFLIFLVGMFPFLVIYFWFEATRSGVNLANPNFYSSYATNAASKLPIPVFIEGLYGQLLSPGRSFFIYSPLLILPIIFWPKIKKVIKPEVIVFLSMSFIYVVFYATNFSVDKSGLDIQGLWHGESSWGPRYLTPLIPFGMFVVAKIYVNLSKIQKLLVFLPLALIGLYIEILGILMPYQIKYQDMEKSFLINGTHYTNFVYTDLLPRYTPIYTMSKKLIKLGQSFPKTLNHGLYNVRFYDGIDFPFNVGLERWRVIEGTGHVSFDNKKSDPVTNITLGLINHSMSDSSASASLKFLLNNQPLLNEKPIILSAHERSLVKLPIKTIFLKPTNNQLLIHVEYDDPNVLKNNSQILGIINGTINDRPINLESIDVPYVSPLGPKMTGAVYQNYGGTNQDLWKTWNIHTQIFERVPDFWWAKTLYYWDFPKQWIFAIFAVNIVALFFFAKKVYLLIKKI
jgi:hypothetical protein